MSHKEKQKVVAYFRTSSMTNVGADKDSEHRQRAAVGRYAKANRLQIVREFYDAGVSGTDAVEGRAGFAEMLGYLADQGIATILVENASRFARDLMVQMVGHALLQKRGVALVPVDAPMHFTEDTPTAKLIRSVLAAVAEFEKDGLVSRLALGRQRKRMKGGRWVGRKTIAERKPEHAQRAILLSQGGNLSLRQIASQMASEGLLSASGKPYVAASLRNLFARQENAPCNH